MSILITGANGQLAHDLLARFGQRAIGVARDQCDLADDASVRRTLVERQPETVINCAAYNNVDQAETEPELAYRVNALGPRTLAEQCEQMGVQLVHVSTDYVFSGATRDVPWCENDRPDPCSAYGVSKLAGEHFVLSTDPRFLVVRTCGLYGVGGSNFVRTMLRLAQTRSRLSIVSDQHCTPTATSDLAMWIDALIASKAAGLVHATNGGSTTWIEFADAIFSAAELSVEIEPISSADFGAKATRPLYSVLDNTLLDSVLDNTLLESMLGVERRDWRTAVTTFVRDLCSSDAGS